MDDKRLEHALRTLRGIRERFETGRATDSRFSRSYTVQVGLGYVDMLWITAAIEALEERAVAGTLVKERLPLDG